MSAAALISVGAQALLAVIAGVLLGLAYFAALHRTVVLLAIGGSWLGPSALTLGRIGGAMILLALAARLGAAPLLGASLGFFLARAIALRTARRSG